MKSIGMTPKELEADRILALRAKWPEAFPERLEIKFRDSLQFGYGSRFGYGIMIIDEEEAVFMILGKWMMILRALECGADVRIRSAEKTEGNYFSAVLAIMEQAAEARERQKSKAADILKAGGIDQVVYVRPENQRGGNES